MIADLRSGFDKYPVDDELQRYLRDVEDHVTQINERIEDYRTALRDMLTVNATLVAQRQNDEMRRLTGTSNAQNEEVKKISAWPAILFAPTLIGTIYGMNSPTCPNSTGDVGTTLRSASWPSPTARSTTCSTPRLALDRFRSRLTMRNNTRPTQPASVSIGQSNTPAQSTGRSQRDGRESRLTRSGRGGLQVLRRRTTLTKATTARPTTRPMSAEISVLTNHAATPPTAPRSDTAFSRSCTRS